MQCTQMTAAGPQCRRRAVVGSDRCASHLRTARRKSTLTDELATNIVTMLRNGVPVPVALGAVNVPKSTFYAWLNTNEAFEERVEQARSIAEAQMVTTISREGRTTWQAAAWWLERVAPERWARISQRKDEAPPEKAVNPFTEFDELSARREAKSSD